RLQHERKTDPARFLERMPRGTERFITSRNYRDSGLRESGTRRGLVSQETHGSGGGADQRNAGVRAGLGEERVFRQKAVPWVYGLGLAHLRGIDNFIDRQIALGGRGRTQAIRFIGHAHVQRGAIRFREDRYRGNRRFPAGADDPDSYFSAVCDEYLTEHSPISLVSNQVIFGRSRETSEAVETARRAVS